MADRRAPNLAAVCLAERPSCKATAWSETVGTAFLAAATSLPVGWREGEREGEYTCIIGRGVRGVKREVMR